MDTEHPTPTPMWEIPDVWVTRGHCPACKSTPLRITHLPDLPDYLACARCDISFEVETGGKLIRVKYVPERYESADAILYKQWVEASSIQGIIERSKIPHVEQNPTAMEASILTNEEIWRRAFGMYRLGNTLKKIELTLLQTGVPQEKTAMVIKKLKKVLAQDQKKQNQKFYITVSTATIVLLIAGGAWLSNNTFRSTSASPVDAKPVAEKLLSLIPSSVKPDLLNSPETSVQYVNISSASSKCPTSAAEAASTFGGDAPQWTKDSQFPAWQMMSTGKPVTVNVPQEMTAAYVNNKSLKVAAATGPAVLYNANFVVISCP